MRSRASAGPSAPPTGSAYTAALRLLGRRDYTSAEVTTRLVDRGYSADDVTAAVERLIADRSLDDRRTADAHVRTAARLKGRGRIRIKQELLARGIPPSVVSDALSGLSADDDARAIAEFLRKKRVPAKLSAAEHRRVFS